jgi:hypothetical protein
VERLTSHQDLFEADPATLTFTKQHRRFTNADELLEAVRPTWAQLGVPIRMPGGRIETLEHEWDRA